MAQSRVVHVALVSEHLQHLLRTETCESVIEQPCLLSCEPLSQVVISAVGKTTDEVTDVVVLLGLLEVLADSLGELLLAWVEDSLDVEFVLLGIGIDLLGHLVMHSLLVLVVHKLDFLEHLKARNGNVLELVDANNIMRWLIIETNWLRLLEAHALVFFVGWVGQITILPILYFLIVNDHFG